MQGCSGSCQGRSVGCGGQGRPVFLLQRSRFSESIQILQVAPLVQELLAVVLPVDIEELPAQLP